MVLAEDKNKGNSKSMRQYAAWKWNMPVWPDALLSII